MTVDDVIMFIDTILKGGQTLEYATNNARQLYRNEPEVVEAALKELERRRVAIRELDEPLTIRDRSIIEPWYIGPMVGHIFWPSVRQSLIAAGLPIAALDDNVDPSSSKILSHIAPPGNPEIKSRGLVVGYVQSGKTTSFTSVIAKAADAGYRLFLVLSGMHDSLRKQTQDRIDRDLIKGTEAKWFNLTHDGDFLNPGNATAILSDPNKRAIAVVKKNPARLRRLLRWLGQAADDAIYNCPILLIDDEADQASIDVGRSRRSTINQRILDLLDHRKAAYIAYTATPFANLLIDPNEENDLYPRDFIISLPKPVGHFGTEAVFGRTAISEDDIPFDGLNVVREIPDTDVTALRAPRDKNARSCWNSPMVDSLSEAIRYFVLSTAARRSRNQTGHSSMLVHTSVYIDVQSAMKAPVEDALRLFQSMLGSASFDDELRALWQREQDAFPYDEVSNALQLESSVEPVAFDALYPWLHIVLGDVEVIVDNSRSTERLEYGESPRTVIALGGNTLSRGLTLEGLVVSYFIRAASAYDTLLQMGRWFGFRHGYEDLPRIWITAELEEWFIHLATVEQEIRNEISRYEAEHRTPRELAVRIRTHSKMTVTAKAKMKGAVQTRVSYTGERLQTFLFNHRNQVELRGNLAAAEKLITDSASAGTRPEKRAGRDGWWILRGVDYGRVKEFINSYRFHPDHADLNPRTMNAYIDAQVARGSLSAWNVVVLGRSDAPFGSRDLGEGIVVNKIARARLNIAGLPHANIKALMTKVDRVADMPEFDDEASNRDDKYLQGKRPRGIGLLLLYVIDAVSEPVRRSTSKAPKSPRTALNAVEDVIGVGIVFPNADDPTPQTYVSAFETPLDIEDAEAETLEALAAQDRIDEEALRSETGGGGELA
jgi:hypothetical protein